MKQLQNKFQLCLKFNKMKIFLLSLLITHNAARTGVGPGEQDWGYVEVRPGAQMFWWFFYTTANVVNHEERPLVLWIQGGPGVAGSGVGNFEEFGPLDMSLKPRKYCWMKDVNVLIFDSPVGTGFSYVNDTGLLCKDNNEIINDLLTALKHFYKLFPKFQEVPLYVASQSYGGKVSAQFAYSLFQEIQTGCIQANFKGVWFGSPWISPVDTTLSYAPFLYNMGIIDRKTHDTVNALALSVVKKIDNGSYFEANTMNNQLLYKTFIEYQVDTYNVIHKVRNAADPSYLLDYNLFKLMNNCVKKKLSIPEEITFGNQTYLVFFALDNDIMVPVTKFVEKLLNETEIKVFVLTGQLDGITPTPGTVQWVENLRWSGKNHFYNSRELTLVVDNTVEGYFKSYSRLSLYRINRSGHKIPTDNPAASYEVLRRFTDNFKGK